jgi:ABC-type microcin C transport system permease subunit YejE
MKTERAYFEVKIFAIIIFISIIAELIRNF